MKDQSPDFTLDVGGIKGFCPVGEAYAKQQMADRTTPVLSCEGPCIRGDIARRAADLVAQEPSLARGCHGESFFVPHSAMAEWVRTADKVVMIDGCFLKCHGRVLQTIVPEKKIVQIDALPLYKKYGGVFLMDEVPEDERKAVARDVADKIIMKLNQTQASACGCGTELCSPRQASKAESSS
jgi:uncharacterized metal-binding protein